MTDAAIESSKRLALREAARRKAEELISALRDMDGSRRGSGFNSVHLGRARDCVEMAVAELER